MRIHRPTKKLVPIFAAVLGAGMLAGPAPAQADVAPLAWNDCPNGYSCYWEHANGGGARWTAPSAGCFNLGEFNPPFNDKISSIWNRGGGVVHLYNWNGSGWVWLDDIPRFAQRSYSSRDSRNDKTDQVCID